MAKPHRSRKRIGSSRKQIAVNSIPTVVIAESHYLLILITKTYWGKQEEATENSLRLHSDSKGHRFESCRVRHFSTISEQK